MRETEQTARSRLRLGVVGGGPGSNIGETHRQAASNGCRSSPMKGFMDAFANIYTDIADAILARRDGVAADPLAYTFPTIADGVLGVKIVEYLFR
jgi:hypothetical protein